MPATLSLAEIAQRLQTEAGQKALGDLYGRLAPKLSRQELLEPVPSQNNPQATFNDAFESAVSTQLHGYFISGSQVGPYMSAAVTDALAAFSDNGQVSLAKVQKSLGPQGMAFLQRLLAAQGGGADPLADKHALDLLSPETSAQVLKSSGVEFPKLEALDYFAKELFQPNELAGMQFFGLQHLFMSSGALFEKLNELGIDWKEMHLLGKIYSTNHMCAELLESHGVDVDGTSKRIRTPIFEKAMGESIHLQLRRLIAGLPRPPEENPEPRIVLIDDGAEAIAALHSEEFRAYAPYFLCVEQTRRGARILKELEKEGLLNTTVANVAETWAKLDWESPMIGHSVMLEVTRKIDELELYGVGTKKEATVIGYGAVGQAVAKALAERGFAVHVYDKNPDRLLLAKEAGMTPHEALDEALPFGAVTVSCVGERTLFPPHFDKLPNGAALFNAASADDELGPQDLKPFASRDTTRDQNGRLWDIFQGKPLCLDDGTAQAHSDSVIRRDGKELLLVGNGYVVNMTGERDPIPPRYIQLTRTLLLLGVLAAKRADKRGVVDVPMDWQKSLVRYVQMVLRRSGEDLQHPNWEKREPIPPPIKYEPPPALFEAGREPLIQNIKVTETAGANFQESGPPGAKVFGYRLGKVERDSMEAAVHAMVGDKSGVLTVEQAALHRAVFELNRHFGISLRASVRADSDAFPERTKPDFVEGKTIEAPADPAERFPVIFARYTVDLGRRFIERKLGHPPTPAELARELSILCAGAKVPLGAVAAHFAASADGNDQALAAALRALPQSAAST